MNHDIVEKNLGIMFALIVVVISFGGLAEIVPLFFLKQTTEPVAGLKPLTALQLEGRDIYIREGCNTCHSQMIRPFRSETERYGHYSVAGESVYNHPFLWGSKRTGPDLARVGERYSDEWHRAHMIDPRSVVPESVMPGYPFLAQRKLNYKDIEAQLKTSAIVGVPYTDEMVENAKVDLETQAGKNTADLEAFLARYPKAQARTFDGNPNEITELDALIAYLQMLGTLVDFASFDESGPNLR